MAIARAILGDSGLEVSRLGIGLAAVARPGYITLGRDADLGSVRTPEALFARSAAILDAAHAAGVRYFDVARSYGQAEEFLARWLAERGIASDAATVGSKWGYRYTAGWKVEARLHEQKELTLERFRSQLEESRALLGDRLSLYQIHSATAESGVLANEPVMRALTEARRAGRFAAVGLTLSGPSSLRTLEQARDVRIDGEPVFDVVQATYNVLEPSLRAALGDASAAGMGVILKEVHANGRLTAANRRAGDAELRRRLDALAAARGLTSDQLAIAFTAALPGAHVVLSGAASPAQLTSHATAFEAELDPATLDALAELAEDSDTYWKSRAALPWS